MSTVLQSFLSYDLNPDLFSLGHIIMVLDVTAGNITFALYIYIYYKAYP